MPLTSDNMQPAELFYPFSQLDIDTAAGHVRRYGDRARLPRVLDDLRLLLVVFGVEDVVWQTAALHQPREALRFFNRVRPDQDGPALPVETLDLVDDGLGLRLLSPKHHIRHFFSD